MQHFSRILFYRKVRSVCKWIYIIQLNDNKLRVDFLKSYCVAFLRKISQIIFEHIRIHKHNYIYLSSCNILLQLTSLWDFKNRLPQRNILKLQFLHFLIILSLLMINFTVETINMSSAQILLEMKVPWSLSDWNFSFFFSYAVILFTSGVGEPMNFI